MCRIDCCRLRSKVANIIKKWTIQGQYGILKSIYEERSLQIFITIINEPTQ
jgi:hypothetical protein